jgi:N-acetylglucosamine-6-phosphate deacetylase
MRIIDLHTHGIGGYDTKTTRGDDILKIAELHGAHGVTDIIPTIYPGPIRIMRKHMAAVKEAMERQRSPVMLSKNSKGVQPFNTKHERRNSKTAKILGLHLEGPFLNPSKSGSLDRATFENPSEKTWKRLAEGFEDIIKIITIAPELEGAQRLIQALSNMGIIVALGHSDATYEETEKAFLAGARGITHLFNAMRGFYHREPGILGFGLMNPEIYVEVIADPFHLNDRTIELIFKVKNPDRIIIVSDSVKHTGETTENTAIEGDNKTLQGGSMTITESAKRLISRGFEEGKVMACISANPLSYILSGQ